MGSRVFSASPVGFDQSGESRLHALAVIEFAIDELVSDAGADIGRWGRIERNTRGLGINSNFSVTSSKVRGTITCLGSTQSLRATLVFFVSE